jgi:16S rRNA (guanine527-N7)-methyltransferase
MVEGSDGPELLKRLFPVSRETEEKLMLYASLLKKWQKSQNLVSPLTLTHLWSRHIADSLQLLELGFSSGPWIDLGSGAGFPGLVLAIAGKGQKNHHVHLVESNKGKCAFLAEVIRATQAPASIYCQRVENCGDSLPKVKKTITARALAPLDQLLRLSAPLFTCESIALFPKGRRVEEELLGARRRWQFDYEQLPSKTDPEGTILRISNVKKIEKG